MKKQFLMSIFFVMTLVLAACGGGGDTEENTGSNDTQTEENKNTNDEVQDNMAENNTGKKEITITASNFQFDQKEYKVAAGTDVTVNFESKQGVHGLLIEGTDVNIQKSGKATVNLEPGTYTIRCSIPCGSGHASMESKLVVE